jgi:hypothetical protein
MTTPPAGERTANEAPKAPALDPWELKPVIRDPKVMARARATYDLYEVAVKMQRQNLRRRYPGASSQEISRRLREWLLQRPGAEHGDASGPSFKVSKRFAHLLGRAERAATR